MFGDDEFNGDQNVSDYIKAVLKSNCHLWEIF